jgi:hypothetical protein
MLKFIFLMFFFAIIYAPTGLIAATEEGKFGLQDFENDVQISFNRQLLSTISNIHADLCESEQILKKDLAEQKIKTINLVFAKIRIYKSDGEFYEQHLHEMMNAPLPFVFDSAGNFEGAKSGESRETIADCCKSKGFCFPQTLPSIEEMAHSCKINTTNRGGFPGICPLFQKKYEGIKELEQQIIRSRQELAHTAARYVSKAEEHTCGDRITDEEEDSTGWMMDNAENHTKTEKYGKYTYEDILADIEEDISDGVEGIKKHKEKHTDMRREFIKVYWHSESRLLALLHDDEKIPVFLNGISRPLKSQVSFIMLHLHSTNNICDNCRLQLTGATYKWLYEKIVQFFIKDDEAYPLFHIIASWYQPCDKIKNIRKRPGVETIDIAEIAAIIDTKTPLSAYTKPFVSIVKLEFPVPAASAAY